MKPKIIFIYNANSGMGNTLLDIGHRLISPKTYTCNLCFVTHDAFGKKDEFVAFLETTGADFEFYHKDEFEQKYPKAEAYPLIIIQHDGNETRLRSDEISTIPDFADLRRLIEQKLLSLKSRSPDPQISRGAIRV